MTINQISKVSTVIQIEDTEIFLFLVFTSSPEFKVYYAIHFYWPVVCCSRYRGCFVNVPNMVVYNFLIKS